MFKPGETIKCIESYDEPGHFTRGRTYEVTEYGSVPENPKYDWVSVKADDNGVPNSWRAEHFELVTNFPGGNVSTETITETVTETTGPKIVKRYTNRKLYDTEESKYLTLRDIVSFIVAGRDVQVIENKTKTDITGQTLLQALVETEVDAAEQTDILRDILKAGGLSKFFTKVVVSDVGTT